MIKVYYAVRKIEENIDYDKSLFSDVVNQHIKRYKTPESFNQSYQTWRLLDQVTKKAFNTRVKDLDISYSMRGKPVCKQYHISLSHIKGYVAVAVSEQECGIDIEQIIERQNIQKIANMLWGGDCKNLKEFYELWTHSEAAAKILDIPISQVKEEKIVLKAKYAVKDDNMICVVCKNPFTLVEI